MIRICDNGVAVTGTTHHAEWCATEGLEHDKFMTGFLRSLIAERNIRRVIQGGAHIGTLTKCFTDQKCQVLAFEPNTDARGCLLHNCPGITVCGVALGEPGQTYAAWNEDSENAGASFCSMGPVETGSVPILVSSIDRFLEYYPFSPDLILLDIEGWEPKALRGARETIKRCRPALVLEVNQGALERAGESKETLFAEIEGNHYDCRIIQPNIKSLLAPMYDVLALPL